jgi:hypothetical protein
MSPGNPKAQYYFATPQAAMAMAHSTDAGIDHGPSLGASYQKKLAQFDIQTVGATAGVNTFELLDYLLYYPGIAMDVDTYTMDNTTTLPRYTDGRGVQIMVVEQSPYVGGATFRINYTNSDGTAGRQTATMTCNTQVTSGTIVTSATATAGCVGLYAALQRGDSGVRSIESVEILSADVGLLCCVLVKPLAYFSIHEITAPNQFSMWRDFSMQPTIVDDAYLNLVCKPSGTIAGAQIVGSVTTIWSAV